VATLRAIGGGPKVLISASAVGLYGDRGAEEIDESSRPASDFLAEVCLGWEREALEARQLGIRVVPVRVGIVLGEKGGAMAKMLTPFYLGLGSPLGSGNQYMPWIHIDDLVGIMLHAAADASVTVPLNGTAPTPVTNREFTKLLGRVLGRPTFMPPVPGFVLRTLLGEFGNVLLGSQRVIPRATLATGYRYQYADLEPALRNILHR